MVELVVDKASQASAAAQALWRRAVALGVRTAPELADILNRFWGIPVQVQFFGVSEKQLSFWRLEECYVSQLALQSEETEENGERPEAVAQLRLSEGTCQRLLAGALGESAQAFRMEAMTRLETSLMAECSRDLFGGLVKTLLKRRVHFRKTPRHVHFIWLVTPDAPAVESKNGLPTRFADTVALGKLVLSVPLPALRLEDVADEEAVTSWLAEEVFSDAMVTAHLALGKAHLRLNEVQALEPGDILVLDESRRDKMTLLSSETDEQFPFTAAIDPGRLPELPMTQDTPAMQDAKQSLWDSLTIEVGAEFVPIRLPLKQLRQMSEGLIVELGDLVQNEIALTVEGRKLATGELLIVGDKFGVRIRSVQGAEETPPPSAYEDIPALPTAAMPSLPAEDMEPAAEAGEGEDFLGDGFNEDFDEEEW